MNHWYQDNYRPIKHEFILRNVMKTYKVLSLEDEDERNFNENAEKKIVVIATFLQSRQVLYPLRYRQPHEWYNFFSIYTNFTTSNLATIVQTLISNGNLSGINLQNCRTWLLTLCSTAVFRKACAMAHWCTVAISLVCRGKKSLLPNGYKLKLASNVIEIIFVE